MFESNIINMSYSFFKRIMCSCAVANTGLSYFTPCPKDNLV